MSLDMKMPTRDRPGARRRLLRILSLPLLLPIVLLVAGSFHMAPTGASPGSTTTTTLEATILTWCKPAACSNSEDGSRWDMVMFRPVELKDTEHVDVPAGMKLVGVLVEVTARGPDPVEVGPAWFKLRAADGSVFDQEFAPGQKVPQLQRRTAYPGQPIQEFVVVAVPEDVTITGGECDMDFGYGDPAYVWAE
jgi:hypothetical protein